MKFCPEVFWPLWKWLFGILLVFFGYALLVMFYGICSALVLSTLRLSSVKYFISLFRLWFQRIQGGQITVVFGGNEVVVQHGWWCLLQWCLEVVVQHGWCLVRWCAQERLGWPRVEDSKQPAAAAAASIRCPPASLDASRAYVSDTLKFATWHLSILPLPLFAT